MQLQNYNNNYYGNAGRTDLYQPPQHPAHSDLVPEPYPQQAASHSALTAPYPHQPAQGAAPSYYAPTHYATTITNISQFDQPPSYTTIYPPNSEDHVPTKPTFFGTTRIGNVD